MGEEQWAALSNVLVYSAMFVLVLAMVFFAAAFAGRKVAPGANDRPARVPVSVGGETPPANDRAVTDPGPSIVEEPGRRAGSIGIALSWLAFGLLVAAVLTRGIWADRAPWGNMYEFSVASATAALGVFLGISTRRDVRWFGLFLVPAVLLTLGLAVTVLYTEAAQLVPALDSYWLFIHVSAAIISGGAFVVGGLFSALYLVRDRSDSRGGTGWAAKLPPAEKLDTMAYRTIAFTMPLWTFAVVAGAIWAEAAWGRYWGWDPKETWALITWLVFAGYLHARSTAGWRGRRAAWLGVIGMSTFVFNYFIVNLVFSGLHSYSGV